MDFEIGRPTAPIFSGRSQRGEGNETDYAGHKRTLRAVATTAHCDIVGNNSAMIASCFPFTQISWRRTLCQLRCEMRVWDMERER